MGDDRAGGEDGRAGHAGGTVKAADAAERLDWIDAAKGIGIVAVVIGHVWTRGALRDAVYAFHMPLFFILAGYVFHARPIGDQARRIVPAVLVPYAAFLIGLYCADWLTEYARGRQPWLHGWEGVGKLAFGGTALTGPYAIFWFPPCLLVARLAQNAIAQRFERPLGGAWIAIALAALAVATVLGRMTDVSPLGLLSVPAALFFLWVGWALKAWTAPAWLPWAAIVPAALALWLLPPVNVKYGDMGAPLLSVAGGIAICLLLFRLAAWVPWMAPLGRASLIIMYMHVPIVHLLTPYLPKAALAALALAAPLAAEMLLRRWRLTAFLFLGRPWRRPA